MGKILEKIKWIVQMWGGGGTEKSLYSKGIGYPL